ncbi:hypothetical protein Tco_0870277 [Tanacetum coccineum]
MADLNQTVSGDVQLLALVDGKKIIITESTVRRDLQLEDAEGVDCLPNSTIFEQLTLMGSKTTAWNEFSSTKASAIICLDRPKSKLTVLTCGSSTNLEVRTGSAKVQQS